MYHILGYKNHFRTLQTVINIFVWEQYKYLQILKWYLHLNYLFILLKILKYIQQRHKIKTQFPEVLCRRYNFLLFLLWYFHLSYALLFWILARLNIAAPAPCQRGIIKGLWLFWVSKDLSWVNFVVVPWKS